MALSPGTRLGPYEVLAPLDAGGMGEVYRARDTRLKFRGFDVAPDGRFILTKQAQEPDTSFHVVLGWDRELARLTKP